MTTKSSLQAKVGFVTIAGNEKQGFLGGFLVLNEHGRPVEFHCTAPVRPTRAQEILYGNTLQSFLLAEQITPALLERLESPLLAILTDSPFVLETQSQMPCPLLFVFGDSIILTGDSDSTATSPLLSLVHLPKTLSIDIASWTERSISGHSFAVPTEIIEQNSPFMELIANLFEILDPCEPFDRIRLAIEEAQKTS